MDSLKATVEVLLYITCTNSVYLCSAWLSKENPHSPYWVVRERKVCVTMTVTVCVRACVCLCLCVCVCRCVSVKNCFLNVQGISLSIEEFTD